MDSPANTNPDMKLGSGPKDEMSYRLLAQDGSLSAGLRRVAEEQLAKGASVLDNPKTDAHESIHEVRKRCKRLRAVLRLVRKGLDDSEIYHEENARYRSLAANLSEFRDATALIESFDRLIRAYEREVDPAAFASIRQALVMRRNALERRDDFNDRLGKVRVALTAAQQGLSNWTQLPDDFDTLAGGLQKTLRRATHAMRGAAGDRSPERFHEWRKQVNYHRHHCRLLSDLFEQPMRARAQVLAELAEVLGNEHDLTMLEQILRSIRNEIGEERALEAVFGLIRARQEGLHHEALTLGGKLFCEKPKYFVRRTGARYEIWRRSWVPRELSFQGAAGGADPEPVG